MNPRRLKFNPVLSLALIGALTLSACSSVAPGADPIEVRAEQTIAVAADTFDEFLKIEYQNVDLVKSKAPAIHQFAEYMRQPIPVDGVLYARDIAIVLAANKTRQAYKANRNDANKATLITALATVEAALSQVQGYLTVLGSTTGATIMSSPPPHAPGAAAGQ